MENEKRYAIRSVKTLEEAYQKYDRKCIVHTKTNAILVSFSALNAALVCMNPVFIPVSLGWSALMISNIWMLAAAKRKRKKMGSCLNETYNELNIKEEERVIDSEGRSR